jgi:glycosyltransferase involved in cell wall biosynthesis
MGAAVKSSLTDRKMLDETKYARIERPQVTAVVPVYNEERCIKDCILSLKNQTIPVEIIIVDDGSTDHSIATCEALGVKVLRQSHKGPGAARNLGARNANGNILVLSDADMTFASDYVERLIEPIVDSQAIATCHWNERVANWENPWARCQTWTLGLPDRMRQPPVIPDHEYIYRAVRKDFFSQSNGFSEEEGRGDDSSISRRTGILSKIVPEAVCYHRNVSSLKECMQEAIWHGRNIVADKHHRVRRCITTLIVRKNPAIEILRGMVLCLNRKEVRIVPYIMCYNIGFVFGVIAALHRGSYLK